MVIDATLIMLEGNSKNYNDYAKVLFMTGFWKINHFVTFNTINISIVSSSKALHRTNQNCFEHRIFLHHKLPAEILKAACVLQ